MALLEVEAIETYYGDSQALFGVSFTVEQGGVTALLGRNGMGKTTTVKTVMGLLHPRRGRVRFAGKNIHAVPAFRVAQAGIGLVPEMRQIFPALSTYENLIATAAHRDQAREPWTLERVFQLFPRLRERQRQLGASLSGGEQQMLAIGRALMTTPRLLILDEATEGLAPLVRAEIWSCLGHLKRAGLSLLVIDKNLAPLLRLADQHIILDTGRVAWSGSAEALRAEPEVRDRYLGV
jgi:branched-chain amino acid transport system ATP-binding protein